MLVMLRPLALVAAAGSLVGFLGCGPKGPVVVPVSGVVTLDGRPVEKASVVFMPADGQPQPATGVTDAAGKFSLVTVIGPNDHAGALPGNYRVVVTKATMSGALADETGLSVDGMQGGIKMEWLIPEKYSRPDSSGLTAQVQPGMAEVALGLQSK
jgi:predicted small lipoprotein YifL